ncbi:MAG: hypothetical protein ABEI27_00560 [Halobellus sp.]|uniref:hypothetical protein n=1 Tax=Halobellus sp. TaxID=1979212 RepID=UPI0035D40627
MPDPPAIDADPWTQTEAWTETAFQNRFVTVEATNVVYEDPEFLHAVEALVPADIDQTPRAMFTTGLSFDPPLPGDKTPERLLPVAAKYASREFERSLAEDGLQNVRQADSQELRLRSRRTASAFQYDASYPLDGDAVGAPDATPTLAVRVWAAIWPTADSFEMAGGIYPLENLATALERVGGTTDVTIEARPGGDRRTVLNRIRDAAR